MKSIKKSIGILILVLSLFSCDEESNFQKSDIQLVPVYSLTEINNGGPEQINIYRGQPLIIEYSSAVNATSFDSTGYSDNSTDTTYEITVNKMVDGEAVNYVISADKATGEGTLVINSGVSVHNVTVSEEEVYN